MLKEFRVVSLRYNTNSLGGAEEYQAFHSVHFPGRDYVQPAIRVSIYCKARYRYVYLLGSNLINFGLKNKETRTTNYHIL
jgi:hypothetical protein